MDVCVRRICTCAIALFSCVAFADDSEDPYRFAYRWGSHRVAFELSESYANLTDVYWPAIEETENQTPRGELVLFPAPILDKITAGVREKIGDAFPMYVPQLAKTVSLRLVTFTLRYCGDGDCGVFGVGETDEVLPELPTPQEIEIAGVVACGVVMIDQSPDGLPKHWGSEYAKSLAGRALGERASTSLHLRAGGRTLEVTLSKPPLDELKVAYGDRLELVEPGDRCSLEILDTRSRETIAFDSTGLYLPTPRGGIYGAGGMESCGHYSNLRVWLLPDLTGEDDQHLLITAGAISVIWVPRAVNDGGMRITALHMNIISP